MKREVLYVCCCVCVIGLCRCRNENVENRKIDNDRYLYRL